MLSVGILGASGYAGGELIRFVDAHPHMHAAFLGAHSKAGQALGTVHPHLTGSERMLASLNDLTSVDLVFLALPHGASAEIGERLAREGVSVVDLGSDFRMDTAQRYLEAYGTEHPYPDQLSSWAYGIPELFGDAIIGAKTVAAPGCYPTSALLALAPLIEAQLIQPHGIVVNSMSGVSGAGRGATEALAFGAIDESVKAYKILEHRHRPEIEAGLDVLSAEPTSVVFTPHLVPMQRGILTTAYGKATEATSTLDLEAAIDKAYAASPFVRRIVGSPETRWVVGSNNALISVYLDQRTSTVVALCAIDNLVKGAAGQAIQCANLMHGFAETDGLPTEGWMP